MRSGANFGSWFLTFSGAAARTSASRFPFRAKPATLRASVGSTEAAKDVVARFGVIDRSIGEPPCALRCRRTEAR
jgi:hypothetical protein